MVHFPLLCILWMLSVASAVAQEALYEFDQPDGFSSPASHRYGDYTVVFSHQSELEVSDNIHLLPDPVAESGWAYTGDLRAQVTGELFGSQMKVSLGSQYMTQKDFQKDDDSDQVALVVDLDLRTQMSAKATNIFSLDIDEEFFNTNDTVYLTRSSGVITSQTVNDTLQIGLGPSLKAEINGYARFGQYTVTDTQESRVGVASVSATEFDREDYALRGQLIWHESAFGELYTIAQITQSDGAAAGLDALEQRSYGAGVGIRQLQGKTKYQFELAYGQADSYERAAGNASNDQLEAFFGQVTVEHQWTPDLRFFVAVNRHVSVDPVSAINGQLITDAIAHLQYSITPNSYAALRLEYPYIEVFETDYAFTVPGASVRYGRRFGERFNVELHVEYDEQRNNAAAREAGFTEYAETAGKIVVNLFF